MPRRLSDRRHRRAVRARRATLHFVPDDRAQGQHPRGPAPADRQSRLRLRRLPAGVPVEPVCAGHRGVRLRGAERSRRRRSRRRCSAGPRRNSTSACAAARFAASATSAGCATSRSDWVMRSYDAAIGRRARCTPRRSFAAGARARCLGTRAAGTKANRRRRHANWQSRYAMPARNVKRVADWRQVPA